MTPLKSNELPLETTRKGSSFGTRTFAREHQNAAVWCPSWSLVKEGCGQKALLAAVSVHDTDMEPARILFGKGNEIAAW